MTTACAAFRVCLLTCALLRASCRVCLRVLCRCTGTPNAFDAFWAEAQRRNYNLFSQEPHTKLSKYALARPRSVLAACSLPVAYPYLTTWT
jgi:hypothetical protein